MGATDVKSIEELNNLKNKNGERNKLMEKIQIASSPMKWNSELSYLVNPIPDNLTVVKTLENILELK